MKFKKTVAAFAAAISIGVLSVGAYATTNSDVSPQYNNPRFSFSFRNENPRYSSLETKEDNLNYAVVHNQSGNIASNMPIYYTVVNDRYIDVSGFVTATSTTSEYAINYSVSPTAGNEYALCAEAGGSFGRDAYISGFWNP